MKNITLATLTTLALVGCGGGGSTPDTAVNTEPTQPTTTYQEPIVEPYNAPQINQDAINVYLSAINTARSKPQDCGVYGIMPAVAPVTWNDALYKASYEHSRDMAINGMHGHIGSATESDWTHTVLNTTAGSTVDERIAVNGYQGSRRYELANMVSGAIDNRSTAIEHVNAYLASDAHCVGLMDAEANEAGMAIYTVDNENSTIVFGAK
jgi:uncharacterized protein YkwD